jgi:hypothetical protein
VARDASAETPPERGLAMIRSLLLLATAAVAAFAFATAASADKPIHEPIDLEGFVLEDSCPFPVLLEVTESNAHVTVFSDGRMHFTGKIFVRLTNLDDPDHVVELNISGPGFISAEGAERGGGRGLVLLRPGEAGGPGVVLVTGRLDIVRGEDGLISGMTLRGRSVDICAMLAA